MALPASDSFTNTDGTQLTTHNSSWSIAETGNFDIQSNALAGDAGQEQGAFWNADTFDDDHIATCDAAAETGGAFMGLAVRVATSGTDRTYYGAYWNTNQCYLFEMVTGSWTQLGSTLTGNDVPDNPEAVEWEASGTTLTFRLEGSDVTTRTDSTLTSGAAGVCASTDSSNARIDNWTGDDVGGAVAASSHIAILGVG